jgi:O-antigen/teichoic acid export membrane protein
MIAAFRLWLAQIKTTYQDPAGLKGRLLRGVTWSLLGVSIVQALKLVTSVIVARILGDVGYGELGIINSTVVTFGIFSGLGLGITATKYVAQLRSRDMARTGQIIGFLLKLAFATGTTMTIAVILFAPFFAEYVLSAPHLALELRLGAVLLLLNALNGVQLGALAGLESFQAIARLNVMDGFLFVLLSSLGAWFLGLSGAIGAYVLVAFVKWIVSQWSLRKACQAYAITISYHHHQANWQILWTFALPALLVSVSSQPFTWISRIMLVNQPNGYSELGIFNAAFAWIGLLLFLPQQISQPSMPILTNLYYESRKSAFLKLIKVTLGLTILAALTVAIPLMFLSPYIMRLYGGGFNDGWIAMTILLVAYAIGAGTLVYRNVLLSTEQVWWQVVHSVIWGITLITSMYVFIQLGSISLAIGYLISFIILFIIQTVHLWSRGYVHT